MPPPQPLLDRRSRQAPTAADNELAADPVRQDMSLTDVPRMRPFLVIGDQSLQGKPLEGKRSDRPDCIGSVALFECCHGQQPKPAGGSHRNVTAVGCALLPAFKSFSSGASRRGLALHRTLAPNASTSLNGHRSRLGRGRFPRLQFGPAVVWWPAGHGEHLGHLGPTGP